MSSTPPAPATLVHSVHAAAFVENIQLRELVEHYPGALRSAHSLRFKVGGGEVFIYSFGAQVFLDVPEPAREAELARLRRAYPGLTSPTVVSEQFTVREDPQARPEVSAGVLVLDAFTEDRASTIAGVVGQSAAMEYYERIVDDLFARTDRLVHRLEQRGTVAIRTRPLHRFIGAAVATRNEVLSILHLLDKPDEIWDDPAIDRMYDRLRAEFDLVDRYQALELKLRSIQESLELVLDAARDRRLVLLEVAIVLLIVLEIALSLLRPH